MRDDAQWSMLLAVSEYRDRGAGERLRAAERAALLETRRREAGTAHAKERAFEAKLRSIAAEPPPEQLEGAFSWNQGEMLPTGRMKPAKHWKALPWIAGAAGLLVVLLVALHQRGTGV